MYYTVWPKGPFPAYLSLPPSISPPCSISHRPCKEEGTERQLQDTPPAVGWKIWGIEGRGPPDHKRSDTALMAFTLSRRRRLTQESLRAVLFYDPGRRKGFGIFCSFVGMQCTIATGAHTCRVVCTFLKILFKQK